MTTEFRKLPSVDLLLSYPRIKELEATFPRLLIVNHIRKQLEVVRCAIEQGNRCPTIDEIALAVAQRINDTISSSLRPVINATGIILHTNLGRAPLSQEAIDAMQAVSHGYSNLEFDLTRGERGSRQVHIERLLCDITGAESGLVVNNNAAAVLLGLNANAKRKEIIISRGQAVEIGDSFRIPDVMRQSGAKLVEVGTTNCTYLADYENAITPSTAALMRVHSSNFKVVGFTKEVSLEELVAVGNKHNIPVFDDQGSGCLLDTTTFGLVKEPMVQMSIDTGVAIVFFSGDKLVGGPQAGIIVGKKQYIDKMRKNPLARAIRIDKVRLAGLIVTLHHYLRGEVTSTIPVWRMISASLDEIASRASVWASATNGLGKVIDGESMVGGGSLPGGTLPTRLVAIAGEGKKSAAFILKLSQMLRRRSTPIVARISDNILLLDPRSVLSDEDNIVVQALNDITRQHT